MSEKKYRKRGWLLRKVALGGVVLIVLVALLAYVLQWGIERRAMKLIREYKTKPSQALADELTRLLDNQSLSTETGNKALETLLTPVVHQRESYRAGHSAHFIHEWPYRLPIERMGIAQKDFSIHENRTSGGGSSSGPANSFDRNKRYLAISPRSATPCIRSETHFYTFSMIPFDYSSGWGWPSKRRFPYNLLPYHYSSTKGPINRNPVYECKITIPMRVNFVDEKEVDAITLVSNSQLDAEMKSAFSIKHVSQSSGEYPSPSGRKKCKGMSQVMISKLPENFAYSMAFTDPDGKEISAEGYTYYPRVKRKDIPGQISITAHQFILEATGSYSGKLILRTDIEEAYKEPDIQQIWDGVIELPISFEVYDATKEVIQ